MGKKGNKLLENSQEVKKLRINISIFLSLVFIVATVVAVGLAYYNSRYAEQYAFLIANYVVLAVSYLIIAIIAIVFAMNKYELNMKKYGDIDKLTSGINYEKFLKEAQTLIEENPDTAFAVFYGDIQNFKYVNDNFGYDVGDKLLMFISKKLKETLDRENQLFARISADNYAIIIPYRDKNEFIEPIYSVIDDISWFEEFKQAHYKPEVYVGIYCSEEGDSALTISEMIDRANMAQKSIKGSSEYHIAFYTEEIRERVIAQKELERRMDTALANGEFKAYYQPKYEVENGEIVGAEALVRWDSPENGFMAPSKFIPLFEQNGFIIELDQYIFESVCKDMREWLDTGVNVVPVSVNVSRLQFYKIDFVKRYTRIKEKYNIPNGLLELEFTESIVFENLDILRKIILSLKKNGFSCSIDDFGSGYSSLNILKNLPMDTIKLDKLFFDDSENVNRDRALISSVITMARALDMETVAEGIENWAQVFFLKEIGCDIIQGYVYSEPIPHARFSNLLQGNRRKEIPQHLAGSKNIVIDDPPEMAVIKYEALLGLLGGLILEVDFNSGKFILLNNSMNDNYFEGSVEQAGENYETSFLESIEKFVHPEDFKIVKNRCSSIAVMSAFYQGEVRIITELRLMSKYSKSYEWAKFTIARINSDPDANDFRAFVYLEQHRGALLENIGQIVISDAVKDVFSNICSLIYEFENEHGTFKRIFCNTELMGDQPEVGDIQWLRECYFPKVLFAEDLQEFLEFTDLKNIEKAVKAGKTQLITSTRAITEEKQLDMQVKIVVVPSKDGVGEYDFIMFCYAEEIEDAPKVKTEQKNKVKM
ncbi:MAG: bifunctional diguanylate cyclase/phosphodiesterase [Ruminococcaceae bacterium]|nr:bifunctional diguanylate cyclase/phosphodiesterase [Oscillospiraceae bacterium]